MITPAPSASSWGRSGFTGHVKRAGHTGCAAHAKRAAHTGCAALLAVALAAGGCARGTVGGGSERSGADTQGSSDGGAGSGGSANSSTGAGLPGTGGGNVTGGTGGTAGSGAALDPTQAWPIHLVGRFVADPHLAGAYDFAWSGSTIIAHFHGPAATLTLSESAPQNAPSGNYYAVSVDGGAPVALATSSGQHDYPLASGLPDADHTVTISRRTEARVGVSALIGISAPGGQMVPFTRAVTRSMWVIGDSISAGYGVEGASSSCAYSTATENAEESYGAVAAASLAADLQITAWAGKGVYQNQFGDMVDLMPALAQRALPADPNSVWDPHTFAPQAVVINLGTNDFLSDTPPQAGFTAAYQALLHTIRGAYPAAFIICALGPMLSDATPPGQMALSTARAYVQGAISGANDPNISYLEFAAGAGTGAGCAQHPNVAAQASMGQQLAAAIAALTGW